MIVPNDSVTLKLEIGALQAHVRTIIAEHHDDLQQLARQTIAEYVEGAAFKREVLAAVQREIAAAMQQSVREALADSRLDEALGRAVREVMQQVVLELGEEYEESKPRRRR